MAGIIWNKNFETGIEIIDKQHQEMFKQIESLSLAVYDGMGKKAVGDMLNFLESYVSNHFETEENIMLDHFYPDVAKHIQQHKEFTESFKKVKDDFIKKGPDSYLAIRIEKEIRNWWENHILKTDRLYIPYLKK